MGLEGHEGDAPRRKPQGGYCSISATALGLLWWSYATDRLSLRAVRVGLALEELRLRRQAHAWTERKRGRAPEFTPNFSVKELAALCGLPPKRAKAALAELEGLGYLVEFSPERIVLAPTPEALSLSADERDEFRSWAALLTKRTRAPVPRRALVLACESSGPALVAVILGVCVRCSWKKPDGFSFTGRVSCPWLSARFRLSPRALQSAKEHLVGLGWIQRTGDISRFGERLVINPEWHRTAATNEAKLRPRRAGGGLSVSADGTNSAGVGPRTGTNSAGPSLTRESLPSEEPKNQRKSRGGRRPESGLGVSTPDSERGKDQGPSGPELPPPRLSRIRPEDFRDVARALDLLRQAVKCRLMPDGENSRLLWMTAIEKARTVGATNPAGLFLFIVKDRKWDYLSQGHEEAARSRLREHFLAERTTPPPPAPGFGGVAKTTPSAVPERPRFSEDAVKLQRLQNHGFHKLEAVYPALREKFGWDRPRFVAARAELEKCRPAAANAL